VHDADSRYSLLNDYVNFLLLFTTKGVAQVFIHFTVKATVVSYNVHANRKTM